MMELAGLQQVLLKTCVNMKSAWDAWDRLPNIQHNKAFLYQKLR
jgi:hypothetical protein